MRNFILQIWIIYFKFALVDSRQKYISNYLRAINNTVLTRLFLGFIFITLTSNIYAKVNYNFNDYIEASNIIGKWLTRSTGHNHFLSATPLSLIRSGESFFVIDKPAKQYASDYGFSQSRIYLNKLIRNAYEVFGIQKSTLHDFFQLNRFHMGFGLGNFADLSLSYFTVPEASMEGFGIGYKKFWWQFGPFFNSYSFNYSYINSKGLLKSHSFMIDYSISFYLRILDFYTGVRHNSSIIDFKSNDPNLKLPDLKYISPINELTLYYGVVWALTLKTRLTFEINQLASYSSYSVKLSMRFNSLLPKVNNIFSDSRNLKQ